MSTTNRNHQRQARQMAQAQGIPYQQALMAVRAPGPFAPALGSGRGPSALDANLSTTLQREVSRVEQLPGCRYLISPGFGITAEYFATKRLAAARAHYTRLEYAGSGDERLILAARMAVADEMSSRSSGEHLASGRPGMNFGDKEALLGKAAVDRYRSEARKARYASTLDQDRYVNAALDPSFWQKALVLAADPYIEPKEFQAALRVEADERMGAAKRPAPEVSDEEWGMMRRFVDRTPEAIPVYTENVADGLGCSLASARKLMSSGELGYVRDLMRRSATLAGYREYWERHGRPGDDPTEVGVRGVLNYGAREAVAFAMKQGV